MAVAVLLSLLASTALGCAPLPPNTNETEIGTTGSFKMNVNPPIAWTSSETPMPPQQIDSSTLDSRIREDITQAVHLFLVDWKYPVDGINVTIDAIPEVLKNLNISTSCEEAEYVANEQQGFVYGKCSSGNSVAFHVPITGKFTAGTLGVPITTELWKALEASVQNKLMTTYHVGFGPGTESLTVTPNT